MEKGQGKGTDTLQKDNNFTHKEYIEREAAKRAIMSQYLNRANKTKYADVIDAVPAADVVPVVRCGECKHFA